MKTREVTWREGFAIGMRTTKSVVEWLDMRKAALDTKIPGAYAIITEGGENVLLIEGSAS
jgi:hypothetical protein